MLSGGNTKPERQCSCRSLPSLNHAVISTHDVLAGYARDMVAAAVVAPAHVTRNLRDFPTKALDLYQIEAVQCGGIIAITSTKTGRSKAFGASDHMSTSSGCRF